MRNCVWDFLFIEAEEASQGIKASHSSQLMTIFRNKDSKANYLLKKGKYLYPRYNPLLRGALAYLHGLLQG